jgi:undecaprenol kinase
MMKNGSFRVRLGYALAGIRIVWGREKSFRTQCGMALAAAAVTAALRPGLVWAALIAICVALVLLLEMVNAALEYVIDRLHPDVHDEIMHAKDAAAGAVLLASFASLIVGGLMILSVLWR